MFIQAATAIAAMVGFSKPSHQVEAKPNVIRKVNAPVNADRWLNLERRQLHVDSINWRWNNQRQERKNRRRRWAAGDRHAFAR